MKRLKYYMTCKTTTLVLTSLLLSTTAHAENKALERAQYMLRQLNSQKVQLEKKNVALTAEVDNLNNEFSKKFKKQKAGNKKLGVAGKKKDRYIVKLKEKLRQTMIALRKSESERLQANTIGQSLGVELKQCVSNNHKLVYMNDKLVDNYNDKGVWEAVSQAEPFTGIKQVEVENILQEYRFKNEDLKVKQKTEYIQSGGPIGINPEQNNFAG